MDMGRRGFERLLLAAIAGHVDAQQPRDQRGLTHERVEPQAPPREPAPSSPEGRLVALAIGNDAYPKAPPLHNARHDASDLAEALRRAHFSVTLLLDANQAALRQGAQQFAASVRDGDVAFLFYAGHGVQIEGENYMVPVDFDPTGGEPHAKSACLRASEVQGQVEKAGARLNIICLDACRDNPFGGRLTRAKGLALMEAGLGSYIALATGPGQTAADNASERNGLFTKHLLIEMNQPAQSLDQLFRNAKNRVFEASRGSQRPWLHADVIGEFFFSPGAAGAAPQPNLPDRAIATDLEQGRREFQAGRFEAAAKSFERAMRIHPEDPFAYNALGSAYMQLGKWSLAVGLLGRAIEMKPDYAAAYFNRGIAYLNAGRYELATQDFSWAIEQEPYDPLALDLRGRAYLSLLDYQNAAEDFERALQLNPSDSVALFGRGKVAFRQGHLPEAVRDLTNSIAFKPSAEAFEIRSQAYRALGKLVQAEEDNREAQRLQPRRNPLP